MSKVIVHYRLHFLADLVWEVARGIEWSGGDTELSGKLKSIATDLHHVAPKLPAEHGLEHGQV
jgi:hypothetical protein